jgi:putative acyl-CoA dehydrogenase
VPDGADAWGQRFRITGHKWFFSAPMCDAFLILAQAPQGLTCFFLPRVLPDGSLNALHIQRLKDKLGNKANASSEVEFEGATAWLVGDEGRGVPQILEMGTMTRLDCALGTSGLMRQALSLALHHTGQREAFGKRLIAQPLMRNVLADLALESEAATALALRLARGYDRRDDPGEAAIARLLTPISKFWICKRGSHFAEEAMATELEARRLAQDVALAVQAALLYQSAPEPVFAAFCDSRLAGNWGQAFGTLGAGTDFDTIIARAMPR